MSTHLNDHLWPAGRSSAEPDLLPNVLDSDGVIVTFNGAKRKTTEATVVNLGDSPNSNNGDPLRTAFAKVNNFIEAEYWVNESINQKFRDIDSELREGIFFYTDSDERYNASLLDNSKVFFQGTENQVKVSVSKLHSSNNPHDFDSEIRFKFGLPQDVKIHNLQVYNHAQFDSDVYVSGNLWVEGTRGELNAETVTVKDNFISMNWNSQNQIAMKTTTGFVFNSINPENGIVEWDTVSNTLTLGLTTSSADSETPTVSQNMVVHGPGSSTYYDELGNALFNQTLSSVGPTINSTYSGSTDTTLGVLATDKHTQVINGSWSQTISGSVTLNVGGDYLIDADGDIILDADGNDIIIKNGLGGDSSTISLSDAGDVTWTAPDDFFFKPTGDTVYFQGTTAGEQLTFQLDAAIQTVTASDDLYLQSGDNTKIVAIGDTTNTNILTVGTSAGTNDGPFVIQFDGTNTVLTGDGTGVIDGGAY